MCSSVPSCVHGGWWWCGVLAAESCWLMGALGPTHLTVGQVSCVIYGIHVGARYLAAIIAEAAAISPASAAVLTPPIGRILFGQRQRRRREELRGQQSRRGIQQAAPAHAPAPSLV